MKNHTVVQRAREAVAILTDRPVPDPVSAVDESLAPGAKGSANVPTNPLAVYLRISLVPYELTNSVEPSSDRRF